MKYLIRVITLVLVFSLLTVNTAASASAPAPYINKQTTLQPALNFTFVEGCEISAPEYIKDGSCHEWGFSNYSPNVDITTVFGAFCYDNGHFGSGYRCSWHGNYSDVTKPIPNDGSIKFVTSCTQDSK